MAPNKKTSNLKQGNLFSFFAKKSDAPKKAAATAAPKNSPKALSVVVASKTSSSSVATTSPASRSNARASSTTKTTPRSNTNTNNNKNVNEESTEPTLAPGTKVEIYWPDDKRWYTAHVQSQQQRNGGKTRVVYTADDTDEWIALRNERWRHSSTTTSKKRKVVLEENDDSDEEMEWDDAEGEEEEDTKGDESDFVDPASEEDDDDEDNWVVSDNEEDDAEVLDTESEEDEPKPKKNKKAKTSVVVKPHRSTTQASPQPRLSTTTSRASSSSFSAMTTPVMSRQGSDGPSYVTPPSHSSSVDGSGGASSSSPRTPTTVAAAGTPLPYVEKAVNPAGSHVHNHLNFVRNPRDAQNRPPTHPDYDGRTLRVVEADWKKHHGGKGMTDAVKQWWDLKAQYFDTVLLFKTGKFYEMFHMDADVGVQVCNLKYMKGHDAHAGFPEVAYGENADKLVRAGYKVARVEQTETPTQLEVRKKQHRRGGGKAPKVVNREVCSILSLGTRTFCYLDERSAFEAEDGGASADAQTGPLLAIREVVYKTTEVPPTNDNDDTPMAACEYGITLVDAIRGTVTLGQFADDVLRSRLQTLLASFTPCEILLQGGTEKASTTLESLIQTYQRTAQHPCRVEIVRTTENAPRSTALDPKIRQQLERAQKQPSPWDTNETLDELHRRKYYPKASKKDPNDRSVSRWPQVLKAVVEGEAKLALSSFGAALFYLQRNLIDTELLSLGIVKAYVPPSSSVVADQEPTEIGRLAAAQDLTEAGVIDQGSNSTTGNIQSSQSSQMDWSSTIPDRVVEDVNHMSLDGTTLHNLEILYNTADGKVAGSLWSKINHTKTPHGNRLLKSWLLRPLFRKGDIDRRADAVEELVSGAAAVALNEARSVLANCGDIDRLLSRVHSMGGNLVEGEADDASSIHPNERAVLYEQATYTKRKVGDFSRVLKGLREASQIPTIFQGLEIRSGLLSKIVKLQEDGGVFPNILPELEFFFDNFDTDKAASGKFEPARGVDSLYDDALDTIERIRTDFKEYQKQTCSSGELGPPARSTWKYVNTNKESKDKYLIELPANVRVPEDFHFVTKRGSGAKQINKYRTNVTTQLVKELEDCYDILDERKAKGMQLIFAKFDSYRNLWQIVANATAMLDALGSLAITSAKPGYSRPTILNCSTDTGAPSVCVSQGRHPCIESSLNSEFIPNDLSLGTESRPSRVLLLSGPNMGGKSTILRQTCMIAILAQVGCFVPAESCEMTPIDRIFTRLGASDKILLGQSTFFVELAETAAALRGASKRSLVIMDELGRGTSTFDGQAIASATIKHLIERSQCLALFATHYHALLEEWNEHPMVRLGHMECMVEDGEGEEDAHRITFLYTLGDGVSPKSFGINVARLAGLPEAVLAKAKQISSEFETQVAGGGSVSSNVIRQNIKSAIDSGDWSTLKEIQAKLRPQRYSQET